MTVIAFKNGVMAADTHQFQNGRRYLNLLPKISNRPELGLLGAAGRSSDCAEVHAWFGRSMTGALPDLSEDKERQMEILWAKLDGTLWWADCRLRWIQIPSPCAAGESSASDFVEGAMLAGASADRAVKMAIKHCIYVGGAVQVERL